MIGQIAVYARKVISAYVVLLGVFLLFLIFASAVSKNVLIKNVERSSLTLEREGVYPTQGISWRKIGLDNFTDALIINTAFSIDNDNILRSALVNMRYMTSPESIDQIGGLSASTKGEGGTLVGYERYWHGYLAYVRPLLAVCDYECIRRLLAFALYGGFIVLMSVLVRKSRVATAIAILMGLLAVDFFFIWKSLQFSGVFLVALYGALFYTLYPKKMSLWMIAFVVGGVTSYIDLLTAPLVSLGILILLTHHHTWRAFLQITASWFLGYGVLWMSKWIIVQVMYSPRSLKTALEVVLYRMQAPTDEQFSNISAVSLNFFSLVGFDKTNKIIDLAFACVLLCIFVRYNKMSLSRFKAMIPLLFVALLPYVWYFFVANHSYSHVWYTYRNQFVSVGIFFLVYFRAIDFDRIRKDILFLFRHGLRQTVQNHKKGTKKV